MFSLRVIRETQSKNTLKLYFLLIRKAGIKIASNAGNDVNNRGPVYTASGDVLESTHHGNLQRGSSQNL